MLSRGERIRESKVRRQHDRADAVRELDAVVDRVVEGQSKADRVRADGLVVVPAHRHVGQPCHDGTRIGAGLSCRSGRIRTICTAPRHRSGYGRAVTRSGMCPRRRTGRRVACSMPKS